MNILRNTIRACVQSTQAYVVANADGMLKLDAMENPNSLPAYMRDELAGRLKDTSLNRYPAPTMPALESALRSSTAIPRGAKVMFGNGSDELIDIVVRACCEPGEVVLSPLPTFVMYGVSAQWAHAKFVGVDLTSNFELHVPDMLKAIERHQPKVIFIANPNNPTGRPFPLGQIKQIIEASNGLVVVDEAYEAFATESFMDQVLQYPNVVVIRTVSKLGLAGIRLGYLVGSGDWVVELDKVRPPYNVNALTRVVAEYVLTNHQVLDEQAAQLVVNRATLSSSLVALGQSMGVNIEPFESKANFVLFRVPKAQKVFEALKAQGILVKHLSTMHPLLSDCIRVTVSTEQENNEFLKGLREAIFQVNSVASA